MHWSESDEWPKQPESRTRPVWPVCGTLLVGAANFIGALP
jgi:hypothetical protein